MNKKMIWSVAAIVVIAAGFAMWNGSKKSGDDPGLPMEVNKDRAEIIMPAEVNAKYFTEPTRHGVVYAKGSNGEKSVLRGLSNEKVFYQALLDGDLEKIYAQIAQLVKRAMSFYDPQSLRENAYHLLLAGFIENGRENRVALAARMKRPRLNDKVSQMAEH